MPDYSFQDRAVECIANDFAENPHLKTLLVIPTGGGKTRTAIKSILRLHDDGFFDSPEHQILWVAHRGELLNQAKGAFDDESDHPRCKEAYKRTKFVSNTPAAQELQGSDKIKLIVIDEAHHAAASTYLPLFHPSIAVLGLTATPSRHDNKPLDFEMESFSIGFNDLERYGVVLRPNVIELEGITSDISGFEESDLEALNTEERNQIIAKALMVHKDKAKKVIVYVGSKKHAKDLCAALSASQLSDHYESISYVTGGEGNNSRGQSREDFFEEEKGYERSIIVNVQVLTEGYDDKKVNAVVMAAPFKSKVNYMQCMGRAIRRDDSDPEKKAYVIELTDNLPNIRYRIDNRWIYSELSDFLEPRIVDMTYVGIDGLNAELGAVYDKYNVKQPNRHFVSSQDPDRYQLLLFKHLLPTREISHLPILLDKENRRRIQNWFNFLSSRIAANKLANKNREQILNMLKPWWGEELDKRMHRMNILDAMLNSLENTNPDAPYITLITFNESLEEHDNSIEEFLSDCLNSSEIITDISTRSPDQEVIFKFPLPLSGNVARLGTVQDLECIEDTINKLRVIAQTPSIEQPHTCTHELSLTKFPFESCLLNSLIHIARDHSPFHMPIA